MNNLFVDCILFCVDIRRLQDYNDQKREGSPLFCRINEREKKQKMQPIETLNKEEQILKSALYFLFPTMRKKNL